MVNQAMLIGTRKRGPGNKLSPAEEAALVARYVGSDDSPKELQAAFGICKQTLYNVLTRNGVDRKKSKGPAPSDGNGATTSPATEMGEAGRLEPDATPSAGPDAIRQAS